MSSLIFPIALSLVLSGSGARPGKISPPVNHQSAALLSFIEQRVAYRTYTNARYGYSVSYPAGILSPQGEPTNGDGQIFRAKDGMAEMRVFGSHRLDRSLEDEYNSAQENRNVTYKLLKNDMFVVSGIENGKIFYQKTLLRGDVFKTFMIEYTEGERSTYDSITARVSRSFRG